MRSGHRNACSEQRRKRRATWAAIGGDQTLRAHEAVTCQGQRARTRPSWRPLVSQPGIVGLDRPPGPVTTAEQIHVAHHTSR
jgi:hypothetical protein